MQEQNGHGLILQLPVRSAKQIAETKETQRLLALLHQWGVHTLGQLAALPRAELAARLGTRALELWDRANGRCHRILKLVSPPESFIESIEFENEIETIEPLLFMLRRFLQQLGTRLNAIYLVAGELRLRLSFSDKSHYERVFKIPQPTNSEEILFRMLHAHLENFSAPEPIVAAELEAQPTRSARQQFGLFETALRDPAQLYETLARLVGLLGAERVGRPVLEETHRPDAFRMEPFVWEFSASSRAKRSEVEGSRRETLQVTSLGSLFARDDGKIPLRRFRKRKRAIVLLENEKPAHVRAEGAEGIVAGQAGPFPISGNWWDEKAWARVEWDVAIEKGELIRTHHDAEGWALDGIYD